MLWELCRWEGGAICTSANSGDTNCVDNVGGEIGEGSITSWHVAANTLTGDDISTNAITSWHVAANTLTGGDIAENTVSSWNIKDSTIGTQDVAANTLTGDDIAGNTVSSWNIKDGTITAADIGDSAIGSTVFTTFEADTGGFDDFYIKGIAASVTADFCGLYSVRIRGSGDCTCRMVRDTADTWHSEAIRYAGSSCEAICQGVCFNT